MMITCESDTVALPDPIPTLTVAGDTYDFSRVGFTDTSGVFLTADGLNRLTVSHRYNKRNRFSVRIDRQKVAADVWTPFNNTEYSHSAYVVWDCPTVGVTPAENQELGQLLYAVLAAGTPDYDLRVLQGEI